MPEQSLPFFLEGMRVQATEAEKSVAALIGHLADEKLKIRENATLELAKLGAAISPQLRVCPKNVCGSANSCRLQRERAEE